MLHVFILVVFGLISVAYIAGVIVALLNHNYKAHPSV